MSFPASWPKSDCLPNVCLVSDVTVVGGTTLGTRRRTREFHKQPHALANYRAGLLIPLEDYSQICRASVPETFRSYANRQQLLPLYEFE